MTKINSKINYLELDAIHTSDNSVAIRPCEACKKSGFVIAKSKANELHHFHQICTNCVRFFPRLSDLPPSLEALHSNEVVVLALTAFAQASLSGFNRYFSKDERAHLITEVLVSFKTFLGKKMLKENRDLRELLSKYEKWKSSPDEEWQRDRRNLVREWRDGRFHIQKSDGTVVLLDCIQFFADRIDDQMRTRYRRYTKHPVGVCDDPEIYGRNGNAAALPGFSDPEGEDYFTPTCVFQDLAELGCRLISRAARGTNYGRKIAKRDIIIWQCFIEVFPYTRSSSEAAARVSEQKRMDSNTVRSIIGRVFTQIKNNAPGIRLDLIR